MKIGFSGGAFGNLLLLSALVGAVAVVVVFIIAKKRGIDVNSTRFQLSLGLGYGIICGVIPFLCTDISVKLKIIGSALALAAGVGNYFSIDRMQKLLKTRFVDKMK